MFKLQSFPLMEHLQSLPHRRKRYSPWPLPEKESCFLQNKIIVDNKSLLLGLMLNRVIVFILLACVISTYFSGDIAIANFNLNQKYISEKLCENRDKPWMHCNGRCYLMKKVKQAEDNEKKQANKDLRNNLQALYYLLPSSPIQKSYMKDSIAQRFKIHYTFCYSNQYNSSIFRPPKSLSIA